MQSRAQIIDVGIGYPIWSYSQQEVAERVGARAPRLKRFFDHDHIRNRHLFIPPASADLGHEKFGDLLHRFVAGAMEMTERAITDCLENRGIGLESIGFFCCVTSTGFIVPALSALLMKKLGFRLDCQRVDIVGMGCNAGLNGLNTVTSWCNTNPGRYAILVCVEVCSAIYAVDENPRTAVVNSLFGDGAAAALIRHDNTAPSLQNITVLDFESQLIPDHIEELRFDWDEEKGRYSFYVGRGAPAAIAAVADQPLARLLQRNGLKKEQIRHWILHGGGNSVLLGIQNKLCLSFQDLRHTRSVLRDFGNLSSGSFLFSLKRLLAEGTIRPGEFAILMTMGPGLTIEMALVLVRP